MELSRHLGVNDDTTWLLHNKTLRAMTERDEAYLLRGKIPMDDADLGGERPAGKAGRGSEHKVPILAAFSLNEPGHPIHARITAVNGFSSAMITDWAKRQLAPGSHGLSDGLACFRAVPTPTSSPSNWTSKGGHVRGSRHSRPRPAIQRWV